MSSACGIRQVESQARAYYATRFTYKSEKPTDLNYSISRVSYVHSSRTTDESLHYFVLPSENQNAFPRSADFEFQFILYSRIETARHLVRSDFLQRSTQNFEIRRRVPRVKKKLTKITHTHTHTQTHTHTHLYLSIRRCNVYFGVPAPVSLSLSLSLSLS